MIFEWDDTKRRANLAKHGVDFEAARGFDWQSAVILPDRRFSYGEDRHQAFGLISGKLHMICFVARGDVIRIVSMRRASRQERRQHGGEKED